MKGKCVVCDKETKLVGKDMCAGDYQKAMVTGWDINKLREWRQAKEQKKSGNTQLAPGTIKVGKTYEDKELQRNGDKETFSNILLRAFKVIELKTQELRRLRREKIQMEENIELVKMELIKSRHEVTKLSKNKLDELEEQEKEAEFIG